MFSIWVLKTPYLYLRHIELRPQHYLRDINIYVVNVPK